MLKIKINNQDIDMNTKGLRFRRKTSLFQYDNIQGSYSYPFTIPNSKTNRIILGFPHRLEKHVNLKIKKNAEVWHSGILILSGIITVTDTNIYSLNCDITVDAGAFSDTVSESYMHEQDFGDPRNYHFFGDYNSDDYDYCLFPVWNPNFYKDTLWEVPDSPEPFFRLTNYSQLGEFSTGEHYDVPMTAFPYLFRVIKLLFEGLGYRVTENFFNQENLKDLVIYTNNDSKEYRTNTGTGYMDSFLDYIYIEKCMPRNYTVKKFIVDLMNLFNISFIFNLDTVRIVNNDDTIISSDYLDWSNKFFDNYEKSITNKLSGVTCDWNLASDEIFAGMVDMNLGNTYFFKTDYFDNSQIPEAKENDVLITKWTATQEKRVILRKKIVRVGSDYKFWWHYYVPSELEYLGIEDTHQFYNFHNTGKELKFSTNIYTLPVMRYEAAGDTFGGYIPHSVQKANSPIRTETVENGFGLLFYNGIVESLSGDDVQTGSNVSKDGALALGWYGEKGLINNFWKYSISHLQNIDNSITAEVNLSASEIRNFDFAKKILINNKFYFVEEIDVSLLINSISIAKIKLIPLSSIGDDVLF